MTDNISSASRLLRPSSLVACDIHSFLFPSEFFNFFFERRKFFFFLPWINFAYRSDTKRFEWWQEKSENDVRISCAHVVALFFVLFSWISKAKINSSSRKLLLFSLLMRWLWKWWNQKKTTTKKITEWERTTATHTRSKKVVPSVACRAVVEFFVQVAKRRMEAAEKIKNERYKRGGGVGEWWWAGVKDRPTTKTSWRTINAPTRPAPHLNQGRPISIPVAGWIQGMNCIALCSTAQQSGHLFHGWYTTVANVARSFSFFSFFLQLLFPRHKNLLVLLLIIWPAFNFYFFFFFFCPKGYDNWFMKSLFLLATDCS